MEDIQKKIRPIYSELRGYLSAAPSENTIFDKSATDLTSQLNGTIDELNTVSLQNYDKFKVQPFSEDWNGHYRVVVKSLEYRNKLTGLIHRVQGEFFSEEQTVSTQPNTVINQTQSQSQSLAIVLELQEKIINEISKHEEGTKERSFLEKIKSVLPNVKTVTDILSSALKIGADLGLDPYTIHKLLGLQ